MLRFFKRCIELFDFHSLFVFFRLNCLLGGFLMLYSMICTSLWVALCILMAVQLWCCCMAVFRLIVSIQNCHKWSLKATCSTRFSSSIWKMVSYMYSLSLCLSVSPFIVYIILFFLWKFLFKVVLKASVLCSVRDQRSVWRGSYRAWNDGFSL